jgi:ABC-type nitrate/sulfonate/bicarbonate transport system substrate-binding protein
MSNATLSSPTNPATDLDQVWYTRCPVPTASGIAYQLGWLADALGSDGLEVGILQDGPPELARHHFDHQLVGLFREGGNVPALAARAEGAPSKLVGLTWIDEWQTILVRPDSAVHGPADLKGARFALPAWAGSRGASFPRAMVLHGAKSALALGGLTLDDVKFVEVPTNVTPGARWGLDRSNSLFGIDALLEGRVDAVYVKGASSAQAALENDLRVAVDLDAHPDKRYRVNNGTPRPITVHERILDEHPELVVKFLAESLRAADWAVDHLDEVRTILAGETWASAAGVETAYRNGFHRSLHPDLSDGRVELFARQKEFLLVHGFLAADFELESWIDRGPLEAARALLDAEGGQRNG